MVEKMVEKRNNISTLGELLENYEIEIPKIQRDYAHGRQDSHSKQVIKNLLKDMKNSLVTGKNLDINFVYGKKVKEKFIPIDGQQRLTTLFLLYMYAFKDDDSKTEMLKKFTYQTRQTSTDFFEKLIENRKDALVLDENDIELYKNSISKKIQDTYWFLSSWKYDPTIISALNVLDLISKEMQEIDDIKNKLGENCPITFKFLDMKKLGMEDDLYIKLNARGRPLTDFENFKAKLQERMRQLDFNENYISNFEIKFDGIWTDYFWKKAKENSGTIKNFDNYYYAFFETLLFNFEIIEIEKDWIDTLDFSKIDEKIFDIISYVLDYISSEDVNDEVDEIIEKNLKGGIYADKILFYALTTYFYNSKGVEKESLKQWIRIIKNLTLNSDIDEIKLFRNALKGINIFANSWDNLLEYFANSDISNNEIRFFNRLQIDEEIIKARIICNDSEFAEEIYKAEKNKYFKGQIRSALYLSKESEKYNKEIFVKYWNRIEKLFGDTSTIYGNLMRRALLVLGDYTMRVDGYKTFCIDSPEDSSHNPTMKDLFSSCQNPETNDNIYNSSYRIVVELLNRVNFDNIKESMEKIIDEANIDIKDWRYCFINYPRLFSAIYMNKNNMRIDKFSDSDGYIIIRNKQAGGINRNLYLSALYEELYNRGLRDKDMEPDNERGSRVTHYLTIGIYKIYFYNGEFRVTRIEEERKIVIYETDKTTDNPIIATAEYIISNYNEK